MIVLVAGTSAVFWYLNDQGIIGSRTETSSDEGIVSGAYDDENPYYYNEKGECILAELSIAVQNLDIEDTLRLIEEWKGEW